MQKIIFASFLFLFFHSLGLATSINPALATVTITPDPIIVCEGETVTAKATVVPSDQYGRVTFEIDSQSTATVTPLTATSGVTTLTIKGLKAGKTTLSGFVDKVKKTSVAVNVIGFEIEINNTAVTDDDYVQIKDDICSHVFTTPCQVKVTGYPPSDVAVTLVNSDDRLGFPTDQKITLTLPASGTWVAFSMTGQEKSKKVGDAVIELHHGGSSDEICKKQNATVFWFDASKITTTAVAKYAYTRSGSYTLLAVPSGNAAIKYSAQSTLKPDLLNASAPQIDPLRIGIVQNTRRHNIRIATYVADHINWSVPPPASVRIPKKQFYTFERPTPLQDSDQDADPLYDQPAIASTIDPNSLNKPLPIGSPSTSIDAPNFPAANILIMPARDRSGNLVGNAVYILSDASMDIKFKTWAVVYNIITKDLVPLRQTKWEVDVAGSSLDTVDVHGDSRASDCPLTGKPFSNDEGTDKTEPGFWNITFKE